MKGEWLKPGAHLDLVGGFTPTMREADDKAVRRARVYVDTRAGALKEAGDIVQPLAPAFCARRESPATSSISAAGTSQGRESADEITLFKSVGTAVEDLAAAILAYESA